MTPMRSVLLALVLVPIVAASPPSDPRLKTLHYKNDNVVLVEGRRGFQSMIQFGPDERIENVAVGDSAQWQVTPNKRANTLFLKPLVVKARTNMTAITDQRVYLFDLRTVPATRPPIYNLRFTYDISERGKPEPEPPKPTQTQTDLRSPTTLDFGWIARGQKDLLPARAFDDGRLLYLDWTVGSTVPALFARNGDGSESPVNYSHAGSRTVVDHVPSQLVMRVGKSRAFLTKRRTQVPSTQSSER